NSVSSFTDTSLPYSDAAADYRGAPYYQIQAHYAGGDSPWSAPVFLFQQEPYPWPATLVRGPQGKSYAVISGVAQSAPAIRLSLVDYSAFLPAVLTNIDVPMNQFTNG